MNNVNKKTIKLYIFLNREITLRNYLTFRENKLSTIKYKE